MNDLLVVLAIAVLVTLFAALTIAEAVITHVGLARAVAMADDERPRAERLAGFLDQREGSLAAVVVLRLVALVGVVGIVVVRAEDAGASGADWFGVAAGLVVVLGTLEVLCRIAVLARADRLALAVTPVIGAAVRVPLLARLATWPTTLLRRRGAAAAADEEPVVSESELLALAEVAAEAEVIEVGERALIESIIAFGDTIVREVMRPRTDMVTVESTWAVGDVMEVAILNGYSRIPVTGDSIDDVVGIVYAKDLMKAERDGGRSRPVSGVLRSARYVPEQKRVAELLPEMQAHQFHMAVVVDEYGGVAGLVTLEDLIEELVGEIVDEYDVEDPLVEPLTGGRYDINARMPVDEVNELLDADLPEGDWDTLGGLFVTHLGRIATAGDTIELGGLRLTAVRVQGRRIAVVRAVPSPAEDEPAQERTQAQPVR